MAQSQVPQIDRGFRQIEGRPAPPASHVTPQPSGVGRTAFHGQRRRASTFALYCVAALFGSFVVALLAVPLLSGDAFLDWLAG